MAKEVVGAIPDTQEVIVKDTETGELTQQPGTEAQVESIVGKVSEAGEQPIEAEAYQAPSEAPTEAPAEIKAPTPQDVEQSLRGTREEVTLAEARAMSDYQRRAALGQLTPQEQAELIPTQPAITPPAGLTKDTPPDKPGGQVATIESKQYYIPGSTMYQMGYSTPEEYAKTGARAANPLSAAPNIAIETPEGTKLIPKTELQAIAQLGGEEAFERKVKAGIIPEGSLYISDTEYMPASRIEELKQTAPELHETLINKGYKAYQEEISKRQESIRDMLGGLPQNLQVAYNNLSQGEFNIQASQAVVNESQKVINSFLNQSGIKVDDKSNLSVSEMEVAFKMGLAPMVLVLNAQNIETINQAINEVNTDYNNYQTARNKLAEAGFVRAQYPEGVPVDISGKQFTIAELANFQVNNPDDTTTIRNYFSEEVASEVNDYNSNISNMVAYLDKGLEPVGKGLSRGLGLTGGELLSVSRAFDATNIPIAGGSPENTWRNLDEDNKRAIALAVSQDPFKSDDIASIARTIEVVGAKNTVTQIATAPVAPIAHVVAKQISLPEIRRMVDEDFANEKSVLSNYVNNDETFNTDRLKFAMSLSDSLKENILKQTGYENADDLVENLEYYNNTLKVTPEEWAIAGAVGALDALALASFGGAAFLRAPYGKYIIAGTEFGAAGIFAPSVIRTIRSTEATTGQKIVAGAGEALLILGGTLVLRPPKLSTISPYGRVKVPMKKVGETTYMVLPAKKIGAEGALVPQYPADVLAPEVPTALAVSKPYSPVVWRGIKFGNYPLVGVLAGAVTVGSKGVTLPPLEEWDLAGLEGRVPWTIETGLEKNILINKDALIKAGMAEEQAGELVSKVKGTLEQVQGFYGTKSPTINAEFLVQPIDTLSAEGVEAVLKQVIADKNIVEEVYGSSTMPPQMTEAEIAEWIRLRGKPPGDIDIILKNTDAEGAAEFVKRVADKINKESSDKVTIDPNEPTHIMSVSKRTGLPKKALETHYQGEILPEGISPEVAESAYGLRIKQPQLKVDIKGVGKLDIATLSETGTGKMSSILEWRRDPATGNILLKPASHRLKDYLDLYTIIKKFNGEKAATKWAESIGLDIEGLKEIEPYIEIYAELTQTTEASPATLDKLVDALGDEYKPKANELISMVKNKGAVGVKEWANKYGYDLGALETLVAQKPSWGWRFSPSPDASLSAVGSFPPLIILSNPSLVSASSTMPVGGTPSGSLIVAPSDYAVSSVPSVVPSEPVSLMVSEIPSGAMSLAPSEAPSGLTSLAPSEAPSSIPVLTLDSLVPSEVPSKPVSPIPSEVPSISPSLIPPEKPPITSPPEAPPIITRGDKEYQEQVDRILPGSFVWIQGRPQGKGEQENIGMFKVLPPPYRSEDLFTMRESPPGYVDEGWSGKGMAKESLQVIGGLPESNVENVENVDLGWARVNLNIEGGKPAIEYVHDEEANVGERNQTVGMGRGQIPIEAWNQAKAQGVAYEDFARNYRGLLVGETSGVSAAKKGMESAVAFESTPAQEARFGESIYGEAESEGESESDRKKKLEEEELEGEEGLPQRQYTKDRIKSISSLDESRIPQAILSEGEMATVETGMIGSPPVEELPENVEVIPSYIRRRKKPKNSKDWWESDYYGEQNGGKVGTGAGVIAERSWHGHRLLPPQLGGQL